MANAQQLPLAVRRALENHFYDTYPDPGSGGTISIGEVGIGICRVTTAGAESRALPAASGYPIGQRLVVILETDGGDLTITGAEDGSVSLDDAGDFAEFIVTQGVSGSTVTRYWRTTLSTTDLGNSVSADSAFGTDDVLVASDGTARKAKATTIDKDDVVTEAAAASGANQVVVSAGATKVVKDSGVAYTNIPTMAANGTSGNLISSAGADKTLQDASVVAANVVTEAAAASGADQIVTSAGASKIVKDSTVAITDVPTMAANGTSGNLISSAGADKTLQDASVVAANVVTASSAAAGADYVIASAAASKAVKDSTIATGDLATMAAAGTSGNLVSSAGANKALQDASIAAADLVTASAAAAGADYVIASAAASKAVKDSTIATGDLVTMAAAGTSGNLVSSAGANKALQDASVAVSDVPTMAAAGTSGNLVSSAGNDKTLQDASVAVANVPTMAAAATGADYVITSAAADKTLQDSTIATQAASSFDVDATEWRIHDAIDTGLTDGGAAVDDLGIVDAGFTVGEVAVRGVTGAGLTDTSYARVRVPLPADYVAGENVTVTFYVTENDGAATSSTIDLEATCANDRTADICATGAQSIAGAASTAYAFTITGTTIVASDILDLRMAIANNDGGGGGNGTSHDIERTKVTFTRQI